MTNISLSLCGDLLISRRIAQAIIEDNEVSTLLKSHECRFGNLETTIHNREGYPAAFPGGGYSMASPQCLSDLHRYGFNLFNTANNHSMDYSCNGLLATIKYLEKEDVAYAGTGKDLSDASRPTYFECKNGRIAMLGVTSSFHDSYRAGYQDQELMGRPGVSPLRHYVIVELDETHYQQLEEIADLIGINNQKKQAIKEGYAFQSKTQSLQFGNPYYWYKKGTEIKKSSFPNKNDLKRTLDWIKDAKNKSDLVVVSVHSHQFDGSLKTNPPEFLKIFSHACIDEGADIIVHHGPHLLRGVECYSNGVIFYGLGNFIFQHEYVEYLPDDFYQKFGLSRQTSYGSSELFDIRNGHKTKGLIADPEAWESCLVSIGLTDETMEIKLYPVSISTKTGLPSLSKDMSVINKMNKLSQPFNTEFKVDNINNVGVLTIKR